MASNLGRRLISTDTPCTVLPCRRSQQLHLGASIPHIENLNADERRRDLSHMILQVSTLLNLAEVFKHDVRVCVRCRDMIGSISDNLRPSSQNLSKIWSFWGPFSRSSRNRPKRVDLGGPKRAQNLRSGKHRMPALVFTLFKKTQALFALDPRQRVNQALLRGGFGRPKMALFGVSGNRPKMDPF